MTHLWQPENLTGIIVIPLSARRPCRGALRVGNKTENPGVVQVRDSRNAAAWRAASGWESGPVAARRSR